MVPGFASTIILLFITILAIITAIIISVLTVVPVFISILLILTLARQLRPPP